MQPHYHMRCLAIRFEGIIYIELYKENLRQPPKILRRCPVSPIFAQQPTKYPNNQPHSPATTSQDLYFNTRVTGFTEFS